MLLTNEGYEKLRQELRHLSTVGRKAIAARLHETRTEGDILNNAGLEDVLNDAGFVEGRIQTLEAILANSVVVANATGDSDTVGVGSYATIVELAGDGTSETYRLVGPAEADPLCGTISYESPLGRQLLGRRAGDEVEVHAPDGELRYRLVAVEQARQYVSS
jgi:transcription elongation factor GreA